MKLTHEQVDAILAKATQTGAERQKAFGKKFNQADYISGVGAALAALGNMSDLPIDWVFSTWSGVKVFVEGDNGTTK